MSDFVNGTGHPIINIYDGTTWHTFELDNCDSSGLQEEYPPERMIRKLWNGDLDIIDEGFYILFHLNYDELSFKNNSLQIKDLKNLCLDVTNLIYLTPRSGLPGRKFLVYDVTDSFTMGLECNSDDSMGNTGLHLTFHTRERKIKYNWVDQDNIGIVFDDFIMV